MRSPLFDVAAPGDVLRHLRSADLSAGDLLTLETVAKSGMQHRTDPHERASWAKSALAVLEQRTLHGNPAFNQVAKATGAASIHAYVFLHLPGPHDEDLGSPDTVASIVLSELPEDTLWARTFSAAFRAAPRAIVDEYGIAPLRTLRSYKNLLAPAKPIAPAIRNPELRAWTRPWLDLRDVLP